MASLTSIASPQQRLAAKTGKRALIRRIMKAKTGQLQNAMDEGRKGGYDIVMLDTAGGSPSIPN